MNCPELPHHAGILVLKDVAAIHERSLNGRLGEAHEKRDRLADEHRVLEALILGAAQHLEVDAVDVEGVGHHLTRDLPDPTSPRRTR